MIELGNQIVLCENNRSEMLTFEYLEDVGNTHFHLNDFIHKC